LAKEDVPDALIRLNSIKIEDFKKDVELKKGKLSTQTKS
jgi:hypothetical protein